MINYNQRIEQCYCKFVIVGDSFVFSQDHVQQIRIFDEKPLELEKLILICFFILLVLFN
jgi:hypothetical protein